MIPNRPTRLEFVRFAAIVAAVAGLLSGSSALGADQRGGRQRDSFSAMSMGRMTRSLNLTDDQAKQIKAIYDSHTADRAARSQAVKSAREALQKATVAVPLNESAIKSAAQAVGQAEGDSALLEARIRASGRRAPEPRSAAEIRELPRERVWPRPSLRVPGKRLTRSFLFSSA